MAKQMGRPRFRKNQWNRRYEPHVEALNRYIDSLRRRDDEGAPPYIAPHYHPADATLLAVSRDPGPKANESGFLSYENDDESAARMEAFFRAAGIDPDNSVPWNAYPWYIHKVGTSRELTDLEIERGLPPLLHVIESLDGLRAIVGFGTSARRALRCLQDLHGDFLAGRGILVAGTYHTSRQALRSNLPTAEQRAREVQRREADILGALRSVAAHIDGALTSSHAETGRVVDVTGRPTGYAGGENERRWKQAVHAAFADSTPLLSPARLAVTIEFRLALSQRGSASPDLDNLIKATVDAMDGVIGLRPIRGRLQADDERIDEIHARKRWCADEEPSGATIELRPYVPADC